MNIKACELAKYHEQQVIHLHLREHKNKLLKADAASISAKAKSLQSRPGQRDKLRTTYGVWNIIHHNGITYALCTSQDYAERHAFQLLGKLREYVDKNGVANQKELSKFVGGLCETYSDASKFDKIKEAQKEVDMLESELSGGISKVLGKQQELDELEDHALQIKGMAKQFEKQSAKLESITFWAKWKFRFMIASIIIGLLALVVVTMMVRL